MGSSASDPSPHVLLALNRASTTAKLLSGAAHEVNNALHVISGTIEMLADRKEQLPDSVTTALERMHRQTAIAAEALASVIVFTRAPLEVDDEVDARELVVHSVALRRFAIRRAGLSMQFDADACPPCFVRGNRGRLQQAVLNLIVNAEQALAGTAGAIEVRLTNDEATVTLRVSDNGPGVSSDVALFETFSSTRPAAQGAGLGLWAARALVESCGGTLALEPAAPGTHAVLTFPRTR